jgi:hypothetical protein
VYDESGQLLGEYDGAGAPIQEVVWFGTTRGSDWIIPDFFPKSCAGHDDCYADQCGKEICDSKFLRDMKAERPDMSVAPWAYYQGVNWLGGGAYQKGGGAQ